MTYEMVPNWRLYTVVSAKYSRRGIEWQSRLGRNIVSMTAPYYRKHTSSSHPFIQGSSRVGRFYEVAYCIESGEVLQRDKPLLKGFKNKLRTLFFLNCRYMWLSECGDNYGSDGVRITDIWKCAPWHLWSQGPCSLGLAWAKSIRDDVCFTFRATIYCTI